MAKVSDFGLARKVSDTGNKSEEALPVSWMSIESIEHDIFTQRSDVVSFRILNIGGRVGHPINLFLINSENN